MTVGPDWPADVVPPLPRLPTYLPTWTIQLDSSSSALLAPPISVSVRLPSSAGCAIAAAVVDDPVYISSSSLAISSSLEKKEGRKSICTTTRERERGMAGSQEKAEGIAERIMPHLLNMYGACATARDFEIYAPNATYDDPLMRAHGVKQIKSAFYTLPKVFGESKIVEYTIIHEKQTGPGKTEVLIDNKQFYKILGKPVDLPSLITLEIHDGKVVRHEDWWNKKPLKKKETVGFPLLGRLAVASRRAAMLLTHPVMCFGKDPNP